jgi:YHS domain-containing protein
MFALLLHGTGEGVLPSRRGQFAGAVVAVEMAVKDTARRTEGWAYYNFSGPDGLRPTAVAMPKNSCFNCHAEHAKRDNVFLQFYPMLAEAAHLTEAAAATAEPAEGTLAVKGLDPVLLTDGRQELGKPEIVMSHNGYRYQFVSEPNRVRFAADPPAFAIQNQTCPVVPGAPIDPAAFIVYKKRIYAFATPDCVGQFRNRPADYVKE